MNEMKKTFVVKLNGGLGNQMFVYAFARAMMIRHNAKLLFDNSLYDNYFRDMGLNAFNVVLDFAPNGLISKLKTPYYSVFSRLNKYLKYPIFHKSSHVIERKFEYDSSVIDINRDAYFDGYWQTEKYFCDVAPIIRNELQFKDSNIVDDNNLLSDILDAESVSVHVRRGDYIKNEATRKKFFVCDKQYFTNAISYIKSRLSNPKFFIFSDDPQYVVENFCLDKNNILIESKSYFEDFYLMQRCRHHIISNSSFSWWAAWLGETNTSITIAPDRWFTAHVRLNYSDIVPERWSKIPTKKTC